MSELKNTIQTAMGLLARREHSTTELFRKLRAREFSIENIEEALIQLEKQGLLSNARFIENYIHYRCKKGFGPIKIQAELIERGLTEEFIEQYMNMNDNIWFIEVRKVWQKRFKNKKPTDYSSRATHSRFLYQRGFTIEQINKIFDECSETT